MRASATGAMIQAKNTGQNIHDLFRESVYMCIVQERHILPWCSMFDVDNSKG